MYSACLFCHASLGRNETVEHFPVGRRLAFDVAKGRLWVVCRRCERWNLTPLEERWEAVEECERLYRRVRLRSATDNIGLARLPDGTELVRVGAPLRPEFAAWRYGDQFGRRRTRQLAITGGGLLVLGGLVAGGAAAGVAVGSFGWLATQMATRVIKGSPDAVVAHVPSASGVLRVKRKHLAKSSIEQESDGSLAMRVRSLEGGTQLLTGEWALRAAGLLLPAVNRFGGSRRDVQAAVGEIERDGDPTRYIGRLAQRAVNVTWVPNARGRSRREGGGPTGLLALHTVDRLALEMALHEEQERRAMEGELAGLERAWREAEEIAAIADDMFLPSGVTERLGAIARHLGR
jgi:hypothetical protein